MEKRRSERAQFFRTLDDSGIRSIWVFRHGEPSAILGLLMDISLEGLQVLTSKESPLDGDLYQLMIFKSPTSEECHLTVFGNRKWSLPEGSLYIKSGFEFEFEAETEQSVADILAACEGEENFLRCELIDLRAPD